MTWRKTKCNSSDNILAKTVSLRHLLAWLVSSFSSRKALVLDYCPAQAVLASRQRSCLKRSPRTKTYSSDYRSVKQDFKARARGCSISCGGNRAKARALLLLAFAFLGAPAGARFCLAHQHRLPRDQILFQLIYSRPIKNGETTWPEIRNQSDSKKRVQPMRRGRNGDPI